MARFAYFFSQFPTLTTTFIQREVRAAEKMGQEVLLIGSRRPRAGAYHPHDEDLVSRTYYLSRCGLTGYLLAHLHWMRRSPSRYVRTFWRCFILNDKFRFQRLNNLKHFIAAGLLADLLRKKGFCHLHVHCAFGAASIAIFVNELSGIPYSISIHGSDVLLPRPLTKEKLEQARCVISNCEFHIDNLRRRFPSLRQQEFHLVRIGLDCHAPLWASTPVATPAQPLRILNVGRLIPVKAQDLLLQACALLKQWSVDFQCRIAGEGPLHRSLMNQIHKLALEDRIHLLGRCYEQEIAEHYEWAHAVVLTSLSEGTPMTLIEAMAKGRACVAPAITAIPELVLDSISGLLFPKGDAKACADALRWLSANPDSISSMGIEGRARAEKYFDVGVTASAFCSVMESIAPSQPRKG
jgi:colanic acid/amylovoran biosynthesis glycosyltransferase